MAKPSRRDCRSLDFAASIAYNALHQWICDRIDACPSAAGAASVL
jgi:hypothetical protein